MNTTSVNESRVEMRDATAEDYEHFAERLLAADEVTVALDSGVSLKCKPLTVEDCSDGYHVELAVLQ